MKLFFSAGEPSGDVHAAALMYRMRERLPESQFVGVGGQNMRRAGCELLADLAQIGVMWIWGVIRNFLTYWRLLNEIKEYFAREKIDVVILIDYPGFNWHVAKLAKKQGIPVLFFIPPQIWSWARWRAKTMKRVVDLVLAPIEFEQRWFEQQGIESVFIGHPFFEEIADKESDKVFLDAFYKKYGNGPVLTLLPGSRNKEVSANLDDIILTIEYVKSMHPNIQPVFAAFNQSQAAFINERLRELGVLIPIFVGRTTELIRAADCCMAVSGSVSLELLACNKPTVVYYKVGKLALLIQRYFRRTRYITLVNLMAIDLERNTTTDSTPAFYPESVFPIPPEPSDEDRDRMMFPEFLTAVDKSKEAAAYITFWLSNHEAMALQKRRLAALLREVDKIESPIDHAINAIVELIDNSGSET
ncbi:MAG: lipid-A-disaccharide synthase [Planctomycetaceae bacterium]|nr:lipid-A-disaccharide synthase [Planctomycetaceae bacterium]